MAKNRVPIPKQIEREVLFRNQSVCCICQKSGVQIHHIDENPANNKLSNLCVLCIEHHSHASSTGTMTKGLDPRLLRKYKTEWEGLVLRRRQHARKIAPTSRRAADKAMLRFEIRKTVFTIPSMRSKSELNRALDYLYNWCLLEADLSDAIGALHEVHWMCAEWQVKGVGARFYEFYWHFVGPHKVSMSRRDERLIKDGIDLLGGLGIQAALLPFKAGVTQVVVDSLLSLNDIGWSYKRPGIRQAVAKVFGEIKKECTVSLAFPENGKVARAEIAKSWTHIERGLEKAGSKARQ